MRLDYFLNPNSKYSKQDFVDSLVDFAAISHGSKLEQRIQLKEELISYRQHLNG